MRHPPYKHVRERERERERDIERERERERAHTHIAYTSEDRHIREKDKQVIAKHEGMRRHRI